MGNRVINQIKNPKKSRRSTKKVFFSLKEHFYRFLSGVRSDRSTFLVLYPPESIMENLLQNPTNCIMLNLRIMRQRKTFPKYHTVNSNMYTWYNMSTITDEDNQETICHIFTLQRLNHTYHIGLYHNQILL